MARVKVKKANFDLAFKALRKAGLIARQNYLCCSGCASFQIAVDAKELVEGGSAILGCVFYHHQDAESMRMGRDFYLSYGQVEHYDADEKVTKIGMNSAEVGELVVDVLSLHGIQTEWNGNPRLRIKVIRKSLW